MVSQLIAHLSTREFQTLSLLAEGLEYNEIAEQMLISVNGVRAHIKSLYRKLRVNNGVQASKIYWRYQFQKAALISIDTSRQLIA